MTSGNHLASDSRIERMMDQIRTHSLFIELQNDRETKKYVEKFLSSHYPDWNEFQIALEELLEPLEIANYNVASFWQFFTEVLEDLQEPE